MSSDTKRLFVGNLPDDTSEQALRNEFASYGAVKIVDVKQQRNVDTGEIKSTFAFVTISIDDRTLDQCLREFKQEKYRGRFLNVTVARESFLDKLKRERDEAAKLEADKNAHKEKHVIEIATETEVKAVLPSFTVKSDAESSSESSSSSDESSSDDEIAPTQNSSKFNGAKKQTPSSGNSSSGTDDDNGNDLVLRKRSKIFLENGKIKIDRNVSGGDAIHVIERSAKSTKKVLDEKSQKADQKRIESLKKMKNSYNEQKLAIKNALTIVDTSKRNNKIVFSDAEEDDINSSSTSAKNSASVNEPKERTARKPALFADDEGDEEDGQNYQNDFKIKEQFQGAKGERLMRLQSRFQNDRRFNMDAKFLEDGNDYGEDNGNQKPENGHDAHEEDANNERQWQYDILESVMGKKIRHNEPPKDPMKKKTPPSMLRFDPTRADHTKFVETTKKRPKKMDKDDFNAKRRKMDEDDEQHEDAPPVSMDQFYEIRGDLKKSMGSGGFSLLSMFGRTGEGAGTTKTIESENKYEEKTIAKNNAKFLADLNPFKYDSSGDEADNETRSKNKAKGSGDADDSRTASNGTIWHESFFILNPNDERLNEGIAFFVPADEDEQPHEIDETKKQELRNIVKRKIKKSVKNALPRHVKPNKRFKRFAKNL